MSFAALIFFYDIIKIFNKNKNNLTENFSPTILVKSIIELGILIITLIYFISLINTSISYLFSGGILLLNSFLLLLTKILELTYKANDVQSQYFAAINKINDINQDINIFWRYKIWLTPRFDIKNLRKNNNEIYRFSENILFKIIFFLVFFGTFNKNLTILVGVIIFITMFLLVILDKIFKTYIKFEGFCLDAEEIHVPRSNRTDGYKYRIVDFNNQREITLFLKNEQFARYRTGDSVVVIHTAIGKKILDHYSVSRN